MVVGQRWQWVSVSLRPRSRQPLEPYADRFARKSHWSCENEAKRPSRTNSTKEDASTAMKVPRRLGGRSTAQRNHLVRGSSPGNEPQSERSDKGDQCVGVEVPWSGLSAVGR